MGITDSTVAGNDESRLPPYPAQPADSTPATWAGLTAHGFVANPVYEDSDDDGDRRGAKRARAGTRGRGRGRGRGGRGRGGRTPGAQAADRAIEQEVAPQQDAVDPMEGVVQEGGGPVQEQHPVRLRLILRPQNTKEAAIDGVPWHHKGGRGSQIQSLKLRLGFPGFKEVWNAGPLDPIPTATSIAIRHLLEHAGVTAPLMKRKSALRSSKANLEVLNGPDSDGEFQPTEERSYGYRGRGKASRGGKYQSRASKFKSAEYVVEDSESPIEDLETEHKIPATPAPRKRKYKSRPVKSFKSPEYIYDSNEEPPVTPPRPKWSPIKPVVQVQVEENGSSSPIPDSTSDDSSQADATSSDHIPSDDHEKEDSFTNFASSSSPLEHFSAPPPPFNLSFPALPELAPRMLTAFAKGAAIALENIAEDHGFEPEQSLLEVIQDLEDEKPIIKNSEGKSVLLGGEWVYETLRALWEEDGSGWEWEETKRGEEGGDGDVKMVDDDEEEFTGFSDEQSDREVSWSGFSPDTHGDVEMQDVENQDVEMTDATIKAPPNYVEARNRPTVEDVLGATLQWIESEVERLEWLASQAKLAGRKRKRGTAQIDM